MGGASSKATFAEIVGTLLKKDVDSNDHDFWDELWKTCLPIEDIFEVISADDVRKLASERPENLKTLFTQAVAQLYQVVETPYPIYFDQALNCARVLSRILPVVLESDAKQIRDLLWSKRFLKAAPAEQKGGEGEAKDESQEEARESAPLAVILVNTMYHLLFLPDFTIEDPNTEFSESDLNSKEFKSALMWAPGVGSAEKTVVNSTQYDSNRVEILRLMIAAFSDSLYQNADSYDSCASLWLEVATSADAPYAEIIFFTLMNTVLGYDPIGWGLPYGNLVTADTAKVVMEYAVQLLVILLDSGHPIRYESSPAAGTTPLTYIDGKDVNAEGFNIFRYYMGQVEAPDQLNFIYKGFVRLLNNVHQSESTYLPYSITRIGIEQELLVLLWKCLEEMPKFMPYILKHCDITDILVPICYFMLEGKKDPAKVGLMYLCTFTLLKLSGERNFGVSLNKPFQQQLPIEIPIFTGNHADLLIIVLHKLIVAGLDKLSPLYNCFLTIICNVSPYCKSLCTVTAVKLVNLFQLFVSPRFLYASEANHVYVGLLLETFNNIIQYQYEGNGNVIYAIIRRKEIFEELFNLSLPEAIHSAQEQQQGGGADKTEKKLTTKEKALKKITGSKEKPSGSKAEPQALGGKRVSEESLDVCAESAPTGLVSTENVVRRPGDETDEHMQQQVPTASGAGTRFVPNQQWLESVKAELPLNTIMRLLKHLGPQLDELSSNSHSLEEQQVIDFLHRTTMVGLLPVPHPIVIRKYQPNKYTCLWFTAFQWGVIFMHNQTVPLFDGKKVKLFLVQTSS